MTTTHVAFRASDGLHRLTDDFIVRMREGARQPEPAVVEAIMTTFIDEALDAFFLKPASFSGLGGTQKRMVQIAADTISKATRLVIGRSARKMNLEQNQAAAEYMDEIRIRAAGGEFWYIAFPIDPTLAERGRALPEMARDGNNAAATEAMISYLRGITNEALVWYFDKPLVLLRFGPVLRKVAMVGVQTTRKASYGVINKVIPKLNGEQLIQTAEYYESMLLDH